MKIGFRELVKNAEAEIETISVQTALQRYQDDDTLVVDLRDVRERKRDGKIPGSFHMPRGMLEFWIDPESPYYNAIFSTKEKFIFYCNKGWRSALATQTAQHMGLQNVVHIDCGFEAWELIEAPVEKN